MTSGSLVAQSQDRKSLRLKFNNPKNDYANSIPYE